MLPTDAPPESGSIQITLALPPVSFQATGSKKAAIKAAIRAIVSPCEYLLVGDLRANIEWRISERARYESDNPADVDNVVKPILDALSGPEGLMVDDCQLQALACSWLGGYSHPQEESVVIDLDFEAEAYVSKAGLVFVQVDKALYFPIDSSLPRSVVLRLADHVAARFQSAREMVAEGLDAESAHSTRPIQRVFHRSKLGTFPIATPEGLRQQAS